MTTISEEILQPSITKKYTEKYPLNFYLDLPGVN